MRTALIGDACACTRASSSTIVFRAVLIVALGLPAFAAAADSNAPAKVNYSEHIHSILQEACVECHRPGFIGPMSLRNFREARPWAKAIKQQVVKREMPPFHESGPLGRFRYDPRLTEDEIRLVADWVDQGCLEGHPLQEEASSTAFVDGEGWQLGQPDVILKIVPYEVKIGGADDNTLHIFDYVVPEDTWIGAVEVLHEDYAVVHHSNVFLYTPTEEFERRRTKKNLDHVTGVAKAAKQYGAPVGGWLPGQKPRWYRPGEVKVLKRNTRLALLNHYSPAELPVTGKSEIGLYYYTGVIDETWETQTPPPQPILIPPGESDYRVQDELEFDEDVLIASYGVHMHLRGKSASVTLIYPNGASEKIFDIPRYDFDWQRNYQLGEPIFVPKGTVALHESAWNNSESNPDNPDPSQEVRGGFSSDDEMWISTIGYTVPNAPVRRIWIHRGKRIMVEDPLEPAIPWREDHYLL